MANDPGKDPFAIMTNAQGCPACGAKEVTAGQFFARKPVGFLPAGLRFWTFKARPVPFSPDAAPHACLTCGLVWLRVDPAHLHRVLQEAGTDETARRFGSLEPES